MSAVSEIFIAADVVADLQFRRQAQQPHRLGDRVLAEFLAELGAARSITTVVDRRSLPS